MVVDLALNLPRHEDGDLSEAEEHASFANEHDEAAKHTLGLDGPQAVSTRVCGPSSRTEELADIQSAVGVQIRLWGREEWTFTTHWTIQTQRIKSITLDAAK